MWYQCGTFFVELEELSKHGTMLPPDMMGLTDEQIEELKLKDEWGEKCLPSGSWTFNKDPMGRRNGRQPNERMQEVIAKSINEAKSLVSKVCRHDNDGRIQQTSIANQLPIFFWDIFNYFAVTVNLFLLRFVL